MGEREMNKSVSESTLRELYFGEGLTFKQMGARLGMATGKVFKIFKEYGLESRPIGMIPGKYHLNSARREAISKRMKGTKRTDEQKKRLSEAKKSIYNGFNGHGHTKLRNDGYVACYAPLHPHSTREGYVLLHRVIMERHIGRYMERDEVAHHLNGKRDDNRIENLLLMREKEHMSMHMKKRYEERRGLSLTDVFLSAD
jgi:hypothetical protein